MLDRAWWFMSQRADELEIRPFKDWLADPIAAAGLDTDDVYRALVIGSDSAVASDFGGTPADLNLGPCHGILVRFNEDAAVTVWVGDEGWFSPEEVVEQGRENEVRGVLFDTPRGEPYLFFDQRLQWLESEQRPSNLASFELGRCLQFMTAALYLVSEGMFEAACEQMFATTELAVMAYVEAFSLPLGGQGTRHERRAQWLVREGPSLLGVTPAEAQVLEELRVARNDWRYGDGNAPLIPKALVDRMSAVKAVVKRAHYVVQTKIYKDNDQSWIVVQELTFGDEAPPEDDPADPRLGEP